MLHGSGRLPRGAAPILASAGDDGNAQSLRGEALASI
jgi:hypothetical protein